MEILIDLIERRGADLSGLKSEIGWSDSLEMVKFLYSIRDFDLKAVMESTSFEDNREIMEWLIIEKGAIPIKFITGYSSLETINWLVEEHDVNLDLLDMKTISKLFEKMIYS